MADSARGVQKRGKRRDDSILDEIVYRAKLLDNRPAFGALLQRYREGRIWLWLHLAFVPPLVDAAEAAEYVAVLYPAGRFKGEHLETGIVPAIDLDGLIHGSGEGRLSVLVDAVEIVEKGQKFPIPRLACCERNPRPAMTGPRGAA